MPTNAIPLSEPDMQLIVRGQAFKIHSIKAIHAHAAAVSAAKDARIKVLEDAIQHYEAALKARWPEGAKGESFGHWNAARAALGDKT